MQSVLNHLLYDWVLEIKSEFGGAIESEMGTFGGGASAVRVIENAECRMQNAECRMALLLILHSAFCILHSAKITSSDASTPPAPRHRSIRRLRHRLRPADRAERSRVESPHRRLRLDRDAAQGPAARTTTLHAGEIASAMEYTPSAANLEGSPFTGHPVTVTTGFVSLIDPGPTTGLRYTGQTATHPNNHNGSVELHFFVRDLATNYNNDADPGDQGSFGLNDMSLPLGGVFDISADWSPPHSRHRFGTDCDIDRYAQLPDGTFTLIDTGTLRDAVRQLRGILLIESGGRLHVQVPEYAVATILLRETR